ncbi:TPA: AAA family ATPase [Morganella morganii]|nr:AAA family ATPase [Morganella morganii]
MITLSKLTLKNFKIFDGNDYYIDFKNNNLILLDGPNGYGKTSVFDAIELGLTGNISRLVTLENRQNPADVVVAHNGALDVEIILEFFSNEGIRCFQRKLKSKIPNSYKKISKFAELWELNEIIDGNPVPINEGTLNTFFECTDLSRDYLLYHYVQQEETSRFLKNNSEVQRAEELAKLFGDTRDSQNKLKKLIDVQKKFSVLFRDLSTKISKLKELYGISDKTSITIGNAEPHFFVFPWFVSNNRSPFWDAESIPELNQDKLNNILQELNSIKKLISFKDYFIRNRINESAARQTETLTLYLAYYNAVRNYDQIIENQKKYNIINNSLEILKTLDYENIKETIDLKILFETLNLSNHKLFETELINLNKEQLKFKGLSSIFIELFKHHELMHKDTLALNDNSICQLCGHDHESHKDLMEAIIKHGVEIKKELGEEEKRLAELRDSFNKEYLQPLILSCNDYLKSTIPLSSEDLVNLEKSVSEKERFEKLRNWLISQNIVHDELLVTSYPIKGGLNSINSNVDALCRVIMSNISMAPKDYHEENGNNIFSRLYREYFNNNSELLYQVKTNDIEKKENYIRSYYFESIRRVIRELNDHTNKIGNLERGINELGGIIDVMKKQIRQYQKKLITDIEIPFYIYSGKILQTHQAGLGNGIFIKDPTGDDELKNVKFVSNWESDHDVLNTMSSGQISAVVISLLLALNKVYCKNFSSIFIDDPVQTMDDINMSSLIELLRNDFKDKQLIMSTHEEKVSRYFTYKYLKHGSNVKIVNLMERKEYIPSNKYVYSTL